MLGRSARLRQAFALVMTLALALPFVLPAPALASKTVGISSPKFEFNVASGQSGKGELYVINDGTEPIKVMVYTANQKTDAKGQISFEVPRIGAPGDPGPAAWFRMQMPEDSKSFGNTPYVELAPKQRVLVKFDFEVPPGVTAGDHQVVIFFEMFDFAQGGGMLSTVTGRVGSRVRIRVQGTLVEKMSVQPFSVREVVIGELMPWSFVARNDGNVDKQVAARLALLDSSENEVVASVVTSETPMYARTMLEKAGTMTLTGAGIGRYTARLTMTYPSEPDDRGETVPKEVVKDRPVWVFPLWLVIGAVVVVGGLVLWLMWISAVKAAERKAKRPPRRARRGGGQGTDQDDGAAPAADPASPPQATTSRHPAELWSPDEDSWS
jgi:uncharacterized protein YndB with AHSA1/START domain